ncbi:RluA family pseudouridine synthase [Catenovulum sp. 2E275]|uniref:RluA family pseudouridine synthase n=1 Tax=Catenovulum sp. 2E275 TaxID=2980497 RepID=UPI0021D1E3ED|nr:RluA family pseudouridine synthase [Catenovulum sp. 2E275]MCU4676699.1 RluA family pseudouridine synthase [Catenovulum sp. 2E275]
MRLNNNELSGNIGVIKNNSVFDYCMQKFIYNPPQDALEIIFEDDSIIVINKPSGLLSNPGRDPKTHDCALTRLQQQYEQVFLVHRLDCETSGILIFAKTKAAEIHLKKQFEARQTEKTYLAEVNGIPKQLTGVMDWPLIADKERIPLQKVCVETGKNAETYYKVLHKKAASCLIELKPVTGRTHQLRVHLLTLGHVILGDNFYAPKKIKQASDRLCLHAMCLKLTHPTTEKMIEFHCPADF